MSSTDQPKTSARHRPMRVVIYAADFEPITIVDLPSWAVAHLWAARAVALSAAPPLSIMPRGGDDAMPPTSWVVRVTAELFRRGAERRMLLITSDEESALLLKSAFLPGQRQALRERERKAFTHGFMGALNRLGKPDG